MQQTKKVSHFSCYFGEKTLTLQAHKTNLLIPYQVMGELQIQRAHWHDRPKSEKVDKADCEVMNKVCEVMERMCCEEHA